MNAILNFNLFALAKRGYCGIDAVLRQAFWATFFALCAMFSFYIVTFFWGNHDWNAVLGSLRWDYQLWQGRWGSHIFGSLLLGGRTLPVLSAVYGFLAFAAAAVGLCVFWRVPRRIECYLVCCFLLTLSPFTLTRLYYVFEIPNIFIAVALTIFGFIVAEKAGRVICAGCGGGAGGKASGWRGSRVARVAAYLALVVLAVALMHACVAAYTASINLLGVLFLGRVLVALVPSADEAGGNCAARGANSNLGADFGANNGASGTAGAGFGANSGADFGANNGAAGADYSREFSQLTLNVPNSNLATDGGQNLAQDILNSNLTAATQTPATTQTQTQTQTQTPAPAQNQPPKTPFSATLKSLASLHTIALCLILTVALCYAILHYLQATGKMNLYYNNHPIAPGLLVENMMIAISTAFNFLIDYRFPYMPNAITLIFTALGALLVAGVALTRRISWGAKGLFALSLALCFVAIALPIGLTVASKVMPRVEFFSLMFFRVLIVALIFRLGVGLLCSAAVAAAAVLVAIFAVNNFTAQRTWYLAAQHDQMFTNRLIDRIEQKPEFDPHKTYYIYYCGFDVNSYDSRRKYNLFTDLPIYSTSYEELDGFAYNAVNSPFGAVAFYSSSIRVGREFITQLHNYHAQGGFKTLTDKLARGGVLERLRVWPHPDSVVIYDDIIVVVRDGHQLNNVLGLTAHIRGKK